MARVRMRNRCLYPSRHPLLLDPRNGPVLVADKIPRRLDPPDRFSHDSAECGAIDRSLRYQQHLLFSVGQILGEDLEDSGLAELQKAFRIWAYFGIQRS